ITPELRRLAAGPSVGGRGGMVSKLEAAELAMRSGGVAVIASGKMPDILDRIFAGALVGTTFVSAARMHGKRRWVAYGANVRGRVIVNNGARDAIVNGKGSLLASGVVRVEREFDSADVVSIADCEGHEFARGLASRPSAVAQIDLSEPGTKARSNNGVLIVRNNIVVLERSNV